MHAPQLNALVDANRADPEYGYRLLRDEAEQVRWSMSRRTAWRLASWQHIRSVISRKQGGSGKIPGTAVADDLVVGDFSTDGPNQLWLTDITEHKTREGTLYVCGAKDVFLKPRCGLFHL